MSPSTCAAIEREGGHVGEPEPAQEYRTAYVDKWAAAALHSWDRAATMLLSSSSRPPSMHQAEPMPICSIAWITLVCSLLLLTITPRLAVSSRP